MIIKAKIACKIKSDSLFHVSKEKKKRIKKPKMWNCISCSSAVLKLPLSYIECGLQSLS